MDYKEFYASIGVSYEVPFRRFGGERLLKKYLGKMAADKTFPLLQAAMAEGNREEAFRAAHTLKGVALNLELTPLVELSSRLSDVLRNVEQIPPEAQELYKELAAVYDRLVEKLKQLEL